MLMMMTTMKKKNFHKWILNFRMDHRLNEPNDQQNKTSLVHHSELSQSWNFNETFANFLNSFIHSFELVSTFLWVLNLFLTSSYNGGIYIVLFDDR